MPPSVARRPRPSEAPPPAGAVEAAPAAAPAPGRRPRRPPCPSRPRCPSRSAPRWRRPQPAQDPVLGHAVLAALPLWAYVYQATLEPAAHRRAHAARPGGEVYVPAAAPAATAPSGGGGVSAPRFDGVLETWPDFRDHMMWVRLGSTRLAASATTYGANDKPKRRRHAGASPTLTDEELAQVVLYERVQLRRPGGGPARSTSSSLAIAEGETDLRRGRARARSPRPSASPRTTSPAG